jgi:hypothetical protein
MDSPNVQNPAKVQSTPPIGGGYFVNFLFGKFTGSTPESTPPCYAHFLAKYTKVHKVGGTFKNLPIRKSTPLYYVNLITPNRHQPSDLIP